MDEAMQYVRRFGAGLRIRGMDATFVTPLPDLVSAYVVRW